jgi:hypothetical protein
MHYPLIPKSNKRLKIGDYWIMKLSDKSYSVGIVIDIPPDDLKLTREIIVGLLNWNDKSIPKTSDLANTKISKQGHAHIKTIEYTGKEIIGNLDLIKNNISPLIMIGSYGANAREFHLMKGYKIVDKFKNSDREKYEMYGYWGYDYIKELAEYTFVKKDKDWL